MAAAMAKMCYASNKTLEQSRLLEGYRNSDLSQSGTRSKCHNFNGHRIVLIANNTQLVLVLYIKQDTFGDNLKNWGMVL